MNMAGHFQSFLLLPTVVAIMLRTPGNLYQENTIIFILNPYVVQSTIHLLVIIIKTNHNNLQKELSNIITSSAWLDKPGIKIQQHLHNNNPRTFNNNTKCSRYKHAFMVHVTPDPSDLLDFSNLDIINDTSTPEFPITPFDDLSIIKHVSPSTFPYLLGESNFLSNNLHSVHNQSIDTPHLFAWLYSQYPER
jgi:hypothetical protein